MLDVMSQSSSYWAKTKRMSSVKQSPSFVRSASGLLANESSEVHVMSKTSHPYNLWRIPKLAHPSTGLEFARSFRFDASMYPGFAEKKQVYARGSMKPSDKAETYCFRPARFPSHAGPVPNSTSPSSHACDVCGTRFRAASTLHSHLAGPQHRRMAQAEERWQRWLLAELAPDVSSDGFRLGPRDPEKRARRPESSANMPPGVGRGGLETGAGQSSDTGGASKSTVSGQKGREDGGAAREGTGAAWGSADGPFRGNREGATAKRRVSSAGSGTTKALAKLARTGSIKGSGLLARSSSIKGQGYSAGAGGRAPGSRARVSPGRRRALALMGRSPSWREARLRDVILDRMEPSKELRQSSHGER